jgi:hypothetical protein
VESNDEFAAQQGEDVDRQSGHGGSRNVLCHMDHGCRKGGRRWRLRLSCAIMMAFGIGPPHQLVVDRRGGGIRTAKSRPYPRQKESQPLPRTNKAEMKNSTTTKSSVRHLATQKRPETTCYLRKTEDRMCGLCQGRTVDGLPCPDTSSMTEGIMAIIECLPVGSRRAPGLSLLCL